MQTVTLEQFMTFDPCWEESDILTITGDKTEWNALEVLAVDSVSAEDRLWVVLREEFLPAEILHEFACRCAEKALALVDNPDPRSVAAIDAKRKWLRGEITDSARDAAWAAARDAQAQMLADLIAEAAP